MSTTETTTFEALGLPQALLKALARAGYTAPTPIQAETIPALLAGRDVLGQAATGTGKTAAFALPILSKLTPGASKPFETGALVLVPTRELALQVTESMKKYSDAMGVSVLAIYGGQEFAVQLRPLKRGVDVVVATPGRAIDHLKRKTLKLDRVRTVILDEADEMLDMGFAEDLEVILSALPAERQVALFSATMPSRILKIAERQMKNPVRVSIARSLSHGEGQKVRQVAYVVPRRQKVEALLRVLELEAPVSALVFCRTRADVDELATVLDEKGFAVEALHGGLSQDQRDRVMKKFKSGAVKYVVATDVAARGIHVDNLSHVINADVPTSPEVYVHRIGRTGRAGREGTAITFAEPGEVRLIKGLERASGGRLQQLQVPSADQVKSKKVKSTQNAVNAAVESGAGAAMRAWVDSLGDALPATAAAAMELLHRAMHNEAPEEAPVQTVEQALAGSRHDAGPKTRPPSSSAARGHSAAAAPRASATRGHEWVAARGAPVSDESGAGSEGAGHSRGGAGRGSPVSDESGAGSENAGHSRGGARRGVHASDQSGARDDEAPPPRGSAGRGAQASDESFSHSDDVPPPRESAGRSAHASEESGAHGRRGDGAKSPRESAGRGTHASDGAKSSRESAGRGTHAGDGAKSPRESAVRRDGAKGPRASAGRGAHTSDDSAAHGGRSEAKGPRASAGHPKAHRARSDEIPAELAPRASVGLAPRSTAERPNRNFEIAAAHPPRALRPSAERPRKAEFQSKPPPRSGPAANRLDPKAMQRGGGGLNDFRATRNEGAKPPPFNRSTKPAEREYVDRDDERRAHREAGPSRGKPGDVVTLWVSAGTDAGIRPGDLVGAIANEAGLHSKQIGPIVINEAFSLVGVPSVAVEAVIDALHSSKLRGRKVKVRREKT